MYCGDETGAFVGDVSSYSSCFGYGGDDCPKSVLASYMHRDGTIPTSLHRTPRSSSSSESQSKSYQQNLQIQQPSPASSPSSLSFQQEDDIVPIYSPYPSGKDALNPDSYLENDGLIQNYDAYENVWMKAFHNLNVRHLGKHYSGYGTNHVEKMNNNNKSNRASAEFQHRGRVKIRRLYQVSSSTIGQNQNNNGQYDDSLDFDNQSLIHPLLAIDSGHTAFHHNHDSKEASTSINNQQRSKILEILFESLSAPAAFIAPSPMLSSFAFGRQTSLIVDIGARGTRVTPIVDGLLLENAQRRSGRGGEWLNAIQHHALNDYIKNKRIRKISNGSSSGSSSISSNGFVHPRYACHHGKEGTTVNYPKGNIRTSIFHDLAIRDTMYEMKTSPHVAGVAVYRDEHWRVPFIHIGAKSANATTEEKSGVEAMELDNDNRDKIVSNNDDSPNKCIQEDETDDDDDDINEDYDKKSKKIYSLPDGTKINLIKTQTGQDMCRIAELFYSQEVPFSNLSSTAEVGTAATTSLSQSTLSSLPIHELVKSSLSAIADIDVRKELCGNIILTGASSLFPNMEQRLSLEVSHLVPNMYRCKVICSRNTLERRYSPWIGGSVLTSLGSFQQLWLSKTEYEEYGATLGTQRFP